LTTFAVALHHAGHDHLPDARARAARREKIKSGLYPTAREVIREGLRLLDERDRLYDARLADLQKEIQKGFASGRATAFNPEALKKKVRTTLARRRKAG
jgi:antitoxin ParD1/3/4